MSAKLPRRLAVLIVLAAAGSTIAGCGGGGNATAASTSTGTSITRGQAIAYGHAVNLHASDLPEMRAASPEHEGHTASAGQRALVRCYGGVDPNRLVAAVGSAKFQGAVEGQFEEIASVVEVQPTAQLAARNLAAIERPRGFACLKRFLPQAVAGHGGADGARFGPATASRLATAFPGVENSFGVQIATTISGGRLGQARLPVYVDAVGFISGPGEVSLIAFGIPRPVPEESLQRLVAALYSRAEAHRL